MIENREINGNASERGSVEYSEELDLRAAEILEQPKPAEKRFAELAEMV